MSVLTQLNSSPYFDDYNPTAINKDFLRVLFKPGYAVQVRELNQLQAILQQQVERFGNTIYQDGSIVVGGGEYPPTPPPPPEDPSAVKLAVTETSLKTLVSVLGFAVTPSLQLSNLYP